MPTVRAADLAERARELLVELDQFTRLGVFDPSGWQGTFTIAANALQCGLLLPALTTLLRTAAPGLDLRVVPSGVPTTAMLRGNQVQLVLTPRPPEGSDILQLLLFRDRYRVFYDAAARQAPRDLGEYLAAEHITVGYEGHQQLTFDEQAQAQGISRRFRLTLPGFESMPPFLRDTTMLVTAPALLHRTSLAGFADCAVPFPAGTLPMFLVWHTRYRTDPANRWIRQELRRLASRTAG
jgi:DNA-binding transcriptional LysR family regulator